ncbi:MAG: TolC family protein [Candidatus Synoicihabitans palmerolidicus]|nr:TolC family protein [Candidatus Synoicihabitans palmerolidicus]
MSVTQTFEWPGRLALRQAFSNQQIELAELGLARFERALMAEARQLAFGLHAAQTQALAVREVSHRFAELRATLVDRDPAGIAALLDLRVIEAADLSLQRRAPSAELAVQSALIDLNRRRGAALDAPLRVEINVPVFASPPPIADLLQAALTHNFDFATRRAELVQQGLRVDLARHEGRPSFIVSPFASSDRETVVGVDFSIPLPVNGEAGLRITAATARQRQAEVALTVARRQLERDLLTSSQAFAARMQDLSVDSTASAAHFQEAATLADRHYRLGAINAGTYVELQRSYLDALEAISRNQADALSAALALEAVTHLTLVTFAPSS